MSKCRHGRFTTRPNLDTGVSPHAPHTLLFSFSFTYIEVQNRRYIFYTQTKDTTKQQWPEARLISIAASLESDWEARSMKLTRRLARESTSFDTFRLAILPSLDTLASWFDSTGRFKMFFFSKNFLFTSFVDVFRDICHVRGCRRCTVWYSTVDGRNSWFSRCKYSSTVESVLVRNWFFWCSIDLGLAQFDRRFLKRSW